MKKLLVFLLIIFCTINIFSQPNIPVFESGKDGHKSYRIPAIIKLNNGHLLAFAEGRVQGASDFGDVNIVLKISTDNGRTWGSIKTIVDYDTLQAGNPAPVVDLTDPAYTTGRIFLFYNTGNKHESDVRNGNGLREVWYKTSTNGGINWSEAVNITLQTHRPKLPQINPAYNFTDDWRSYANTPGHAMQFETGKYKGRIYIAANHSEGGIQNESMDYIAHGFYTDDHGKTFHISNNVNLPGGNENMAAELSDGRIMLNIRNQRGDVRARYIAISSNGGQSWDTSYFDKNLPDPVCQGSLLTIGKKRKQNILAFSNAADEKRRDNLTLRISFDDGKTWKKNFVIYKNPSQPDAAAYSDIVKLSGKKIGVLYEKDNYSKIVFTVVKWK